MLKQADFVLRGLRKLFPIFSLLLIFAFGHTASAQITKAISGTVTDAETGEPLPYVTIFVKLPNHTNKGTTTDFSGIYHIIVPATSGDSIYASYVGYLQTAKLRPKENTSVVDFQMKANSQILKTVTITPKTYVNPAWAIMEAIVKHKDDNNLES